MSETDAGGHLVPLVLREFAAATGGLEITADEARGIIRSVLNGRQIDHPAAYLVHAIRAAPDPFALLPAATETAPVPRPRAYGAARPVAEVIPNYAERTASIRAFYAEQARRIANGEPTIWAERDEQARRADEARRAAAHPEPAAPARPVLPADTPGTLPVDADAFDDDTEPGGLPPPAGTPASDDA